MPARQCLNKLFVTPKHYRRYEASGTCVFDDKTRPHKKGEFFVHKNCQFIMEPKINRYYVRT